MTTRRDADGRSSRNTAKRFGKSSEVIQVTPVRLPPGRARLTTKPVVTASQALMTIGTVRVAFLAATIASSPIARMTSTFASTSSRARRGSSPGRPSAKRYSTVTSLPSEYLSSLIRFWKGVGGLAAPKPRYPTFGSRSDCAGAKLALPRSRAAATSGADKRPIRSSLRVRSLISSSIGFLDTEGTHLTRSPKAGRSSWTGQGWAKVCDTPLLAGRLLRKHYARPHRSRTRNKGDEIPASHGASRTLTFCEWRAQH